jgi:hypothetical protein
MSLIVGRRVSYLAAALNDFEPEVSTFGDQTEKPSVALTETVTQDAED